MGGRPRKPKTIKMIQGTFRADRNPVHEPEPSPLSTELIKIPSSLNRWAKKFWKDHIEEFTSMGLITSADIETFEMAAQTYGSWKEAEYEIYHDEFKRKRTIGQYMKMRGYNRQNMPELIVMEKSRMDFVRLSGLIGMNPVSRNKIDVKKPQGETDPMDEILQSSAK